jgi:short-subunit dehydrogenase
MADDLRGRVVLITGASSGIGRAAARRFLSRGSRVVGLARSPEPLAELGREAGPAGEFVPMVADVTDAARMREVATQVVDELGVPDVVVANAGVGLDALFEKTSDEALRRVFEVNVFGLVRSVRPFVAGMRRRGSGRILLISSIVGKRGIPYYSAYSASKFALHGLAEALRTELYGSGVSVGLVCPSSTDTGFHDRALREGPGQRRVRPRRHSAESVADVVVAMATSRRREIVVSAEAKLLSLASRLVPGLVDRLLARMLTNRSNG